MDNGHIEGKISVYRSNDTDGVGWRIHISDLPSWVMEDINREITEKGIRLAGSTTWLGSNGLKYTGIQFVTGKPFIEKIQEEPVVGVGNSPELVSDRGYHGRFPSMTEFKDCGEDESKSSS
jgi:hypothetical protein